MRGRAGAGGRFSGSRPRPSGRQGAARTRRSPGRARRSGRRSWPMGSSSRRALRPASTAVMRARRSSLGRSSSPWIPSFRIRPSSVMPWTTRVVAMTPKARKMTMSRPGNGEPSGSSRGIDMAAASVTVPRMPAHPTTSTLAMGGRTSRPSHAPEAERQVGGGDDPDDPGQDRRPRDRRGEPESWAVVNWWCTAAKSVGNCRPRRTNAMPFSQKMTMRPDARGVLARLDVHADGIAPAGVEAGGDHREDAGHIAGRPRGGRPRTAS